MWDNLGYFQSWLLQSSWCRMYLRCWSWLWVSPQHGNSSRRGILGINTYSFIQCLGGMLGHLRWARGGICQRCSKVLVARRAGQSNSNNQAGFTILFMSVSHDLMLAYAWNVGHEVFSRQSLTSQNNSTVIPPLISHFAEKTGTWMLFSEKWSYTTPNNVGVVGLKLM